MGLARLQRPQHCPLMEVMAVYRPAQQSHLQVPPLHSDRAQTLGRGKLGEEWVALAAKADSRHGT